MQQSNQKKTNSATSSTGESQKIKTAQTAAGSHSMHHERDCNMTESAIPKDRTMDSTVLAIQNQLDAAGRTNPVSEVSRTTNSVKDEETDDYKRSVQSIAVQD